MRAGAAINVQVLNEIANVMRRKPSMSWREINDVLALNRAICPAEPLTAGIYDGSDLSRCGLNVYDAVIGSRSYRGCKTLYSEDLQDGLLIDGQLHIRNPFTAN